MKNSEIREFTTKEIAERIDTEKDKLTRLKLNHAISPLENPMVLVEAKKDVARLKTEMRKRMLTETK
ncbi:MAG TPA: 50S ribosomal protein L29 [Prolixibacteraceae bacterium]|nr:50S ribosomal protein L29 [Prolixibacteraceae bacterium]HPR86356.1 50S ribosomal protein L29 [Prolixibacteraceae bacterium]